MSTTTKTMTAEELLAMPGDGYRYELIAGELIKMNPANFEHGAITHRVSLRLGVYVEREDLGILFAAETGFKIASNPDTVRAPDVAFVRKDRVSAEDYSKAYWPDAPDLVVEVVSPGNSIKQVDEKVKSWLEAGTQQVWVVNPRWRTVTVYRSSSDIATLTENDTIDGGETIPGFQCRVGEFFVT